MAVFYVVSNPKEDVVELEKSSKKVDWSNKSTCSSAWRTAKYAIEV